jgi:hypothetical protein
MEDFCPACKKTVEYETSETQDFCTICGRSKSVANQFVKRQAKTERWRLIKHVLIGIGIFMLAVLLLWAFSINPDRMSAKLFETFAGMIGFLFILAIPVILFFTIRALIEGIRNMFRKSKK